MGFILALNMAEFIYGPGYSVSLNTISDLGATCVAGVCMIPKSALFFDGSVFLKGLATVVASYYLYRAFKRRTFSGFLVLSGVGAMGVGLFPENYGVVHSDFTFVTFFFGVLSVFAAFPIEKRPLNYLSVVLGLISLASLVIMLQPELFNYLGIGKGGVERMIAYPLLLWGTALGGQLIATNPKTLPG